MIEFTGIPGRERDKIFYTNSGPNVRFMSFGMSMTNLVLNVYFDFFSQHENQKVVQIARNDLF